MTKTHILTVTLEAGHEDCLAAWKAEDHKNHCGGTWWLGCLQYELTCPHEPAGNSPECTLWMECDHSRPDPDAYPCLPECADDCGRYHLVPNGKPYPFDKTYVNDHWCANAKALAEAEDAWDESHPHGPYEPSTGCWAQYALWEDHDAAIGFEIGVHEVSVENEGYMEDSYLRLEPISA